MFREKLKSHLNVDQLMMISILSARFLVVGVVVFIILTSDIDQVCISILSERMLTILTTSYYIVNEEVLVMKTLF